MDPGDQMDQIYEGIVHWADVIVEIETEEPLEGLRKSIAFLRTVEL